MTVLPGLLHDFNRNSRGIPGRIFLGSALIGADLQIRDTGLSVGQILHELDRCGETRLLQNFKNLTPKDIMRCRAIAAHHMPERAEYQKNGAGTDVRAIIDENLPHTLAEKISNNAIRLEHASFHQLSSTPDQTIWQYIIDRGFAAVFTSDDDFVRLSDMAILKALMEADSFDRDVISDKPLIVRIDPSLSDSVLKEETCRRHIGSIARASRTNPRPMNSMTITPDGLIPGPSARGVYQKYIRPSIGGIHMDHPVFDTRILDHHMINLLRAKFGFEPMNFTTLPQWKIVYDRYYAQKQRADSHACPA